MESVMAGDTRLIYGFDPLCGWCYGFVPAMQALREAFPDLPVDLALPGLVTGARIGPYAAMADYIRGASARLKAVTGRAPSDAFFRLISDPALMSSSGPPALVLAHARTRDPAKAVDFAHRLIEAHFEQGANYNDPAIYPPLLAASGLPADMPDLGPAAAERLWQAERHHGITSFPALIVQRGGVGHRMPSLYDPVEVVDAVRTLAIGPDPKTGARPGALR
jgi:putative protein-disulfide isomerase